MLREDYRILERLTPRLNHYIPHIPTPKQSAFLCLTCRDAFFGGAASGGKSDALLMAALQYVDIPGYNAVLFRDTFQNLIKPSGLISRAHEWLQNTDARWNGDEKKYTFPSGATLNFSYLDGPLDHFNHQSAEYQFVGIDEMVQIRENQALYLFSRLRRLKTMQHVPIRFRGASNPPAKEQIATGAWVKRRYIDPDNRYDSQTKEYRVFIPARIVDNPYVDAEDYIKSLYNLDPVTRKPLIDGIGSEDDRASV